MHARRTDGRRIPLQQVFDGGGKFQAIRRFFRRQHADQPQFRCARGTDQLFLTRLRARHNQRWLIEGQNFAISIVAAHGNDSLRPGNAIFHAVVELDDFQKRMRIAGLPEAAAKVGRHVRTEHDDRLVGKACICLIGSNHITNEIGSISAATGGDKQIIALLRIRQARILGGVPLQEADKIHLRADALRNIDASQGVIEIGGP